MDTISTYCDWHLGDHFVHLHYLRKLATRYPEKRFIHAAKQGYLPQLIDVVSDLRNITLVDTKYKPVDAHNVWKNRDGFFFGHPKQDDYVGVFIEFFDYISNLIGVVNPIQSPADFLFDYPAIRSAKFPDFDFLVINSAPLSGQFVGFDSNQFNELIGLLLKRGYSVITTAPSSHDGVPCTQTQIPALSVTAIGSLSLSCKYIVGVSTAPSWPTFNIWNTDSVLLRVLLLDRERVLIAPNTEHVKTIPDMLRILRDRELL